MTDFQSYQEKMGEILPIIADWYEKNKKDLPWRKEPTPYHVWISEIMLQQTRIEAVLSYYARFLKVLPTVEDLAKADDELLMKLWQGLGYYSRARNLKKAAIVIMEQYGGKLPSTAEELRRLPGIGEYTAGAIASIAYHQSEPAVDGNVLRVVSRLLASCDDIMLASVKKSVTALLASCYPEGRGAALTTEGLMELGEVVCIPNGLPKCDACPVKALCEGFKQGIAAELPVREVKKDKRHEEKTVLLLRSENGRYAIRKREETGLLANLWEFVTLDGFAAEGDVESYLLEHGTKMKAIEPLLDAKHIFTHVVWEMKGFAVSVLSETKDFVWKTKDEILSTFAIPTAYKTYVKVLEKQ